MINVCFAGITGWTAPPIVAAIDAADDLALTSGVSRSAAGQSLAAVTGLGVTGGIYATVGEAVTSAQVDVLVDYTSAAAVKGNRHNPGDRGQLNSEMLHGTSISQPLLLAGLAAVRVFVRSRKPLSSNGRPAAITVARRSSVPTGISTSRPVMAPADRIRTEPAKAWTTCWRR